MEFDPNDVLFLLNSTRRARTMRQHLFEFRRTQIKERVK